MLIQYQNTFEEYVEASEALAARKRKKRRANAWVYTLVMVVFFFAAMWLYQTVGHVNQFVVTFQLFAPIAFSFAIVAIVLCVASVMSGRLPRGASPAVRLGVFLLMLTPVFILYRSFPTINPRSPRFIWHWTLLLPHTTWLFFVAWITILTVKGQRNKTKILWDEQPSLHRAKPLRFPPKGLSSLIPFPGGRFIGMDLSAGRKRRGYLSCFTLSTGFYFFPRALSHPRRNLKACGRCAIHPRKCCDGISSHSIRCRNIDSTAAAGAGKFIHVIGIQTGRKG